MNIFKPLTTPEYLFRPRQILYRLRYALGKKPNAGYAVVTVPWGAPLRIRPREVIGSNIWHYGVFDLVVTETICRLLDRGETALDIGANLGQMTSLMCCRTGSSGRVVAFEPHPELFSELQFNVSALPEGAQTKPELYPLALSDTRGEASLDMGQAWADNRGLSKLVDANASGNSRCVTVKLARLDDLWVPSSESKAAVLKIDVEGHELKVFQGAAKAMATRKIRDIIFEDFDPYPSAVHRLLLDHGYTIFSLHSTLWRPHLGQPGPATRFNVARDGQNYLATLDPDRAKSRFRAIGWQSLRRQLPG
jgi:FkbM family methyltransferase